MKDIMKRKLTLLISILALLVFAGSLFALFSDVVTGSATIKAGTLDIEAEYEITLNGNLILEEKELENFNPGDTVVVTGIIKNSGTKSAWIRDSIKVNVDGLFNEKLEDGRSVITIYDGEGTKSLVGKNKITLDENGFATNATSIINGTIEKESHTDHRVISPEDYLVSYIIKFEEDAGNNAQGKSLSLTFKTEALQYRNNPEASSEDDWGQIDEFTLDLDKKQTP